MLWLVACCAVLGGPAVAAEEADLQLRIAWGGGTSRQWKGVFQLSQGALSDLRGLGLEADAPGSIDLDHDTVRVTQPRPRNYDGMDLRVQAPLDAQLTIELRPMEGPEEVHRATVSVRELVNELYDVPLDEQGNRLLVRRAPGDQLRVQFSRESLVFSPGEQFQWEVLPHRLSIAADTPVRCTVQLVSNANGEELWREERDGRVGESGSMASLEPFSFSLTIPSEEGVYDLQIGLAPRRLTPSFVRTRPLVQRKVQLVVIGPRPSAVQTESWRQVVEIDPAHPRWWERLTSLRTLKVIPGFGQGQPLNNGKERTREHAQGRLMQLEPGGWLAYPLPISQVGEPHILEVEYPNDLKQTLGISLLEPDAAGKVVPLGLDSGVDVPEVAPGAGKLERHRLVFWPRTKTPLVLLTNRRSDGPAVFGRLRVLAGPDRLPAASGVADSEDSRLLAAYYDKPLFAENFSAAEVLDPATQRTLDDWSTFYLGGRRLAEYLQYAGYNGAVLSVVCEGSSLYPSQWLEPTPKYDTGVFFATGQDPQRKDVLEMLFRLFDREGLKLVPAVQFAGPLPELERLLRQGGPEAAGIRLTAEDGQTWAARNGTRRGLAPYYNPLDPRVQAAMRRVVQELAERYGHHRSFAGVALQLGPDTYVQFPDESWGNDPQTRARFLKASRSESSAQEDSAAPAADFLQTPAGRRAWLQWRADKLAELYEAMQQDISQQRSGSRLYVATADLLTAPPVQSSWRPALPTRLPLSGTLLRLGIDPKRYQQNPDIVLLRPHRTGPLTSLASQAIELEPEAVRELDGFFHGQEHRGSQYFHEPLPLRLPDFDAVSPFGAENTQTWLMAHIAPSSVYNRRRFVRTLAAADTHTILDGGWMAVLGQERAVEELMEVYRRLPDAPFDTIAVDMPRQGASPVVIRRLARGNRTYVYLVNASPWPVSVSLQLDVPEGCRLESLSRRRLPALGRRGGPSVWKVQLQPYDLVGGRLTASDVQLKNPRIEIHGPVEQELGQRIQQLRGRLHALQAPRPLQVLSNPGFELSAPDHPLPGWVHATGAGITVAPDRSQRRNGQQSLHLRSTGPVAWVRSEPFDAPTTGRVSVVVWLKIADPQKQPPLRLAVEGRYQNKTYYRYCMVGTGETPLKDRWESQPYLFHLDDLPARGLSELRVGFDLMGMGEVWIDDVQLFDVWFHEHERDELLKHIALADYYLGHSMVTDCQRVLAGYWPRFLLAHVPPDAARLAARRPAERPAAPQAEAKEPPSHWERFVPKIPLRVPFKVPFQTPFQ